MQVHDIVLGVEVHDGFSWGGCASHATVEGVLMRGYPLTPGEMDAKVNAWNQRAQGWVEWRA